jgi:PTH1 family peptidyl-tRNA hydrolase
VGQQTRIQLVVGLGNPGTGYDETRHNVGFWFVDRQARLAGASFRLQARFHGEVCTLGAGQDCVRLLKPATFMNRSGQSVAALAQFYRLQPESILVIHDDLDLPAGVVRLKREGGHGGHNGLRDLIAHLHSNRFCRMRIGIDHPGPGANVVDYVLRSPPPSERLKILEAIEAGLRELAVLLAGDLERAMQALHSRSV